MRSSSAHSFLDKRFHGPIARDNATPERFGMSGTRTRSSIGVSDQGTNRGLQRSPKRAPRELEFRQDGLPAFVDDRRDVITCDDGRKGAPQRLVREVEAGAASACEHAQNHHDGLICVNAGQGNAPAAKPEDVVGWIYESKPLGVFLELESLRVEPVRVWVQRLVVEDGPAVGSRI